MLSIKERINLLVKLGDYLISVEASALQQLIEKAGSENPWFTSANIKLSLQAIRTTFLQRDILEAWAGKYKLDDNIPQHKIGLVLAGNIPMVGWHDILSCFLCNKISVIKYSDKDKILIPFLLGKMTEFDKRAAFYFEQTEKLTDYDAVIATGSNNSATIFEYYFRDVPHIIRKNRSAVAILTGDETSAQLEALADDVFSYYGLGCRNVGKLFVPEEYDFSDLFHAFGKYEDIIHHHKYRNNFDYNLALFLLNKETILQHEIIILRYSTQTASRTGSLNYEYYQDLDTLKSELVNIEDEIQCIIGRQIPGLNNTFDFGQSQCPGIEDYADGVDTVQFLLQL